MDEIKKIKSNDEIQYRNSYGELHNPNGPALIWNDGTSKAYYLNNKLHRLDGPAIENSSGIKEWWVNGKRHRLDGPAIIYLNGDGQYYINDNYAGSNKNEFYDNIKFNCDNKKTIPQNKIDILNIKNAIQNNIDENYVQLLKSLL